jgi:Alpha/beta-hydrolase family/Alpha/beta-hydrolase family N-terminus
VILGFLATGVLPRAGIAAADSVFGGIDNGTAAGIAEPATPLRSGSPASLGPWDTLGRQGRTFVDTGPTEAEISKFSGTAAMEPIRVYVGLKSAPTIAAESDLAVRELERTGAFHRKVIVVATTTGTGWLNPAMIDPLEYMYNGDTAVVGAPSTRPGARSASPPCRPSSISQARGGNSRASSTCRTPRTRSSGGHGAWPSISQTGCGEPTRRTCRRRCTGIRS